MSAIGKQKTGDDPKLYSDVSGYYSSRQFAARYDCVYWLMPYDHLKYDPWEQLIQFREFLERQPDTSSTFKVTECDVGLITSGQMKGRKLMRLLGCYKLREGRNPPWVNPTYPMFEELEWTPTMDKRQFYFQLAIWGMWSRSEAATYFNDNRSNVHQVLKHRGIEWGEARDWGRERMANTVLLTRAWEGRTIAEQARALGMPTRTLVDWTNKYATLEEIPDRPKGQQYARKWEYTPQ